MRFKFQSKYRAKIESGEYTLYTRCGNPARIVCWDVNAYHPILGLVHREEGEEVRTYFADGTVVKGKQHYDDLYVDDKEPVPTKFEKDLSRLLSQELAIEYNIGDRDEYGRLKELAEKVLSIAEESINDSKAMFYVSDKSYKKGYQAGYRDAKEEKEIVEVIQQYGNE